MNLIFVIWAILCVGVSVIPFVKEHVWCVIIVIDGNENITMEIMRAILTTSLSFHDDVNNKIYWIDTASFFGLRQLILLMAYNYY